MGQDRGLDQGLDQDQDRKQNQEEQVGMEETAETVEVDVDAGAVVEAVAEVAADAEQGEFVQTMDRPMVAAVEIVVVTLRLVNVAVTTVHSCHSSVVAYQDVHLVVEQGAPFA